MAFVVETGEGLADANSYASHAGYVAYWTERGAGPTEGQEDIEKALVRATDFLGIRYRFVGQRATAAQGLEWPRVSAYRGNFAFDARCVAIEGVPVEVLKATYELGKRALAGELAPDPVLDESGQTMVSSRDKLGPIETERTFTGGAASTWVKRFPAVDQLLRDLVVREGGRVHRA